MSIEAEIEAAVSAFVADLMELVRTAALESVRVALRSPGETLAPPARRRVAVAPPRSKPAERQAARAPAPASLRPRGSGPPTVRSFQVEPTGNFSIPFGKPVATPAAPKLAPGVVVRRIPPKRRRDGRNAAPAPHPAPAPLVEAGPTEPKKWVVVRRPARPASPDGAGTAAPVEAAAPPAAPKAPAPQIPVAPPTIIVAPPAAPASSKAVDVEAPTSKPAPSKPPARLEETRVPAEAKGPTSKRAKAPASQAPASKAPASKAPASKATAKGPASKRARTAEP